MPLILGINVRNMSFNPFLCNMFLDCIFINKYRRITLTTFSDCRHVQRWLYEHNSLNNHINNTQNYILSKLQTIHGISC